jgi:hypothetical protein
MHNRFIVAWVLEAISVSREHVLSDIVACGTKAIRPTPLLNDIEGRLHVQDEKARSAVLRHRPASVTQEAVREGVIDHNGTASAQALLNPFHSDVAGTLPLLDGNTLPTT